MANWTPADDLGNIEAWYKETGIQVSGSDVIGWLDETSNNHDLTLDGTTNPQTATIDSKTVVDFDGTDQLLGLGSVMSALNGTEYTVFIVAKNDVNTGTDWMLGTKNSTATTDTRLQIGWRDTDTFSIAHYGDDADYDLLTKDTLIHLMTAMYKDPGSELWTDGDSEGTDTNPTGDLNSDDEFIIGGRWNSYYDGKICEVIVWPGAITTAQRERIEGYLAWKWGFGSNLPGSHHYNNGAPQTEYTWSGGGIDDLWSRVNNWSTGVVPVGDMDESLKFAGSTRLTPDNDLGNGKAFKDITFAVGASGFDLGGDSIEVTGDFHQDSSNNQEISMNMVFNSTPIFFGTTNTLTISGIISGYGGVQKNDLHKLSLEGLNTYTGQTVLVQGTLEYDTIENAGGGASALGNPTGGNAIIEIGSFSPDLRYTGVTKSTNRGIELAGSGSRTIRSTAAKLTLTGNITHSGTGTRTIILQGAGGGEISGNIPDNGGSAVSIVKNGNTGNWELSGTNTFSGTITINAGKIIAGSTTALGSNAAVTIANVSTAELRLASVNVTIGSLAGTGPNGKVFLEGDQVSRLTIGSDNTDTTFGGVIDDGHSTLEGGIAKTGTGKLTLTNANLYWWNTQINNGTLIVNGSQYDNDEIHANSGSTIRGTGIIKGDLHVYSGATLAPGTDALPGVLNAAKIGGHAMYLYATTALVFRLGTSSDRVDILPDGPPVSDLTLDGNLTVQAAAGFGPGSYTLINYDGVLTNNGLNIVFLPPGYQGFIDTSEAGKVKIIINETGSEEDLEGNLDGELKGGFQ
jgi:autotransporter-associated beta strand protein